MLKRKKKMHIERLLLSRLKIMGYILCIFSLAWFLYALVTSYTGPDSLLQEFALQQDSLGIDFVEGSPHEVLNFFLIALLFFFLGILCFFISRKRNKSSRRKP